MKNIEKVIKDFCATVKTDVKTTAKMDTRVINDATAAHQKSKMKQSASSKPNIWRIIMKNKITKLATAAIIIIAVLAGMYNFTGSIDGSGVAWAELVQQVEQSHDEYMRELLSAMEETDLEKAHFYSCLLEEFWQKLGWMTRAKIEPEFKIRMLTMITNQKARYKKRGQSAQEGIQLFLEYEDQFNNWLGEIEDKAWINETAHVCKQLEEYGEEIRDAGEDSWLGFSYAEHCIPSFVTYCEWFNQLPWDNPEQVMAPVIHLTGIERDLKIARREIASLEIFDVDRFVKRCMDQVSKNALELVKKTESSGMNNQWKLCRQLTQRIDELCDLIGYAQIARWEFLQTAKAKGNSESYQSGISRWREGSYPTGDKEICHHVLKAEFGNKASFADYFIGRIDLALDLCRQLSEELESMQ
ncbi:MAG: hypothetical protein ACYTFK_01170 [Planctomycetota bacterium]|jgi:hypothetical protein